MTVARDKGTPKEQNPPFLSFQIYLRSDLFTGVNT